MVHPDSPGRAMRSGNWPFVEVTAAGGTVVRLRGAAAPSRVLRLGVAREYWSSAVLSVSSRDGRTLGTKLIDHVDAFEHVDIDLSEPDMNASKDGVSLSLERGKPLSIFTAFDPGDARYYAPRLLQRKPVDTVDQFLRGFSSGASLQAFGWKLGCVLDGLDGLFGSTGDPAYARRESQHLAHYYTEGELSYKDPWGMDRQNSIYGIEGLLPLASIARRIDTARALELAEATILDARNPRTGAIQDGPMLSAEGMYTVAFPLALLGIRCGRPDLRHEASRQLQLRVERLRRAETIVLRRYDDGRVEFMDWIRAWCWFLLGLARTIPLLQAGTERTGLAGAFRWAADKVTTLQHDDGLWRTFVREPRSPIETSGTAGIAAALAIGSREGLLSGRHYSSAVRATRALIPYVTSDGLLSGASQANKDGVRLQRSPQRVNSQVGSGLLAQALAHIDLRDI